MLRFAERFCITAHYLSLSITSTINFNHSSLNSTANRGFLSKGFGKFRR